MQSVDWFLDKLEEQFGVKAEPNQVGYEGYELTHEEIDDYLIPVEHLKKLPNPILVEMLNYMDEGGNEWIAGIVVEQTAHKWLYTVWLKNGERVLNCFLK